MADTKKNKDNSKKEKKSFFPKNKEQKKEKKKKDTVVHEHTQKNKTLKEYNKEIAIKKHEEELVKMRKKQKIDKNSLILFAVIFFVAFILFIKTMGTLLAVITSLGIIVIILCSMLLKKIRRNKVIRIITNIFTIFFLLGCIAAVCGVTYFAYIIVTEAPDWNPKQLTERETTIFYDSTGENIIYELATKKRENIDFDEVSENLIDAIVAVEDSRFFQHNGFDPLRFFKASLAQLAGNHNAGGASTLSMQLAKTSFTDANLDKFNSEGIKRKFTDIYIAVFKLEKNYTKEAIFEFYINKHFLGSNAYGVQQAAQTYFQKDAADLTIAEAATIAGMFQSPNEYNPFNYPEAATERRNTVLDLMYTHGYISEEERNDAKAIPIESLLATSTSSVQKYQLYIDTVIDELINKRGIDPYEVSLNVYTNIDIKKQQGLEDIFHGKTFKWENDKVQAGIAAVDVWSGKITAIAGGRNTTPRALNRAADSTQFNNQIGSTAKPIFDYAPAMEYLGYSTYTLIKDEPYSYSSGQPIRNSDRKYMGTITLRTALAQSRNVPALKTFQKVNNNDIYNFVTSLGITPETSNGSTYLHEAHSIGSFNGATPLQMAAAYAAFANGGTYYEPYTVNKIVYRDTGETVEYEPESRKVMSDSTAFMITYCLRTAVTDGLSSGAAVDGINVAAKTGTTNWSSEDAKNLGLPSYAVHDAWIVGYDPDTAVGMWYGYDKIEKGTQYFLKSASSGFKVNVQTERNRLYQAAGKVLFSSNGKDFKVPDSVVKVAVEKGTNPARLASSSTPASKITYEYFRVGTEPTEMSFTYSHLANVSNLRANYSGGDVTLSWSGVANGADYDESYGKIGYKIYLNNKYLGFTTNTSYVVKNQSDPVGTYKVITTYENTNEADSSGATVSLSNETVNPVKYTVDLNIGSLSYQLDDDLNQCLNKSTVNSKCVILKKNDELVESGYTVELSIIDNNTNSAIDEIPKGIVGSYTVKYTVKYNGNNVGTKSVTITITE